MRSPLSRRTLLRGAGGIAVSLPLLNAMEVRGATLEGPKRFGAMMMMASPVADKWWPTGTETHFTLGASLSPLSDPAIKSKLLVLRGIGYKSAALGNVGDGHHRVLAGMLTGAEQLPGPFYLNAGWANGPSIDQVLASQVGLDPVRSLTLAAGLTGNNDCTRTSYRAASDPVDPINNPAGVWDRLFKNFSTDTTPNETSLAIEALRRRRASILDAVKDDYDALQKTLGTEDRQRVAGHLESVRSLERRVTAVQPPVSAACVKPPRPTSYTSYPNSTYPELVRLHLDMMVHAFACDLTRVFTLQTAQGISQMQFPWLDINIKQHDEINHNTTNYHLLEPISKWYAEMFRDFLLALDAKKEGDRSILDNSLLWYTYEHENANMHSRSSIPMLIAGTAGGQLRSGRYLNYTGKAHNDLFVTMLNLMGVPATTFGAESVCTGALPGLT